MDREKKAFIIVDVYNDPDYGFKSIEKMYHTLKELYPEVSWKKKFIRDIIRKIETYQLTRYARTKKNVNPYTSFTAPNQRIQIDLLDVSNIAKNLNKQTTFLFVAVDVFSKKTWVFPLTQKTPNQTMAALEQIIEETDYHSKASDIEEFDKNQNSKAEIQSDNGKEFVNNLWKDYLKEKGITHLTSQVYSSTTQGFAERMNRTIRGKLLKYMRQYETMKYIDALPKLIENYNNTKHKTTKFTPNEVHFSKDESLFEQVHENIKAASKQNLYFERLPPLEENDLVRVLLKDEINKNTFRKNSSEINWSFTVFRVYDKGEIEPKYKLITHKKHEEDEDVKYNIKRRYYRYELQKIQEPEYFQTPKEKLIRKPKKIEAPELAIEDRLVGRRSRNIRIPSRFRED